MIRCNLDLLRVQKERQEGRKLPYRVIAEETKLSPSTLVRLMNNQFDRVDADTLDSLCEYFGAGVGELLEYVSGEEGAGGGGMIIAQDDLDRWRAFVEQVRNATFNVRMAAARRDTARANEVLSELHDAAITAGMGMEQAGAQRPDSLPSAPSVRLEHLSTPANRRYLDTLRAAYDAALAVDRERYGENIGTDGCAQAVELILRDVEQECFGAVGRLRE